MRPSGRTHLAQLAIVLEHTRMAGEGGVDLRLTYHWYWRATQPAR